MSTAQQLQKEEAIPATRLDVAGIDLQALAIMRLGGFPVPFPEMMDNRGRVVGLGEYQPVADNEDGSARARNRRLEFTLQPVAQRVVKAEFQQ